MLKSKRATRRNAVALRKESVDRNSTASIMQPQATASLSARRAWIEIPLLMLRLRLVLVALRKESVDRNPKQDGNWGWGEGRSPQGERG